MVAEWTLITFSNLKCSQTQVTLSPSNAHNYFGQLDLSFEKRRRKGNFSEEGLLVKGLVNRIGVYSKGVLIWAFTIRCLGLRYRPLPEVNEVSIIDITGIENNSKICNPVATPTQITEQVHGHLISRCLLQVDIFQKSAAESLRPEVALTYHGVVLCVILHCSTTLCFKRQRRYIVDDKVLEPYNTSTAISQ